MHIVYVDEAGTHKEARHFIVGGLAVFERETYYLARALDQLQAKYLPDEAAPVPFHASGLRGHAPPPFDGLTPAQRRALIDEVYGVIAESNVRIFAVAMEKAAVEGDPYERGLRRLSTGSTAWSPASHAKEMKATRAYRRGGVELPQQSGAACQ